jgi:peptide/nickel transport system permease protein
MRIFGHKAPITAQIGLAIVLLNVLVAVLGPMIAPYSQSESVGTTWDPPSAQMLLGADQIGRDMLTRLIYGARMTIGIAVVTTLISFAIGITFGFMAAELGRWVDLVLSRIVDVILSIPLLIFALIILGVFGSSIPTLVLTIAVLDSTRVFRLARALAMNITVLEYVEAARVRGEGLWWVLRREILPNAVSPLLSEFGLRFCFNFLFVAALSFLGLGVQPPYADWGGMVRENAPAINFGMFAPLYPAMAIALLTVGINLVVDWLLAIEAGPAGAHAEL